MNKFIRFSFVLCFSLLFFSCASIKQREYKVCGAPELNCEDEGFEKKSVRIVHISDFHSNDFGKKEEKLIKKVVDAKPDVIMLTGDIFDFEQKKEKPVENVRLLLNGIKELAPVFYVSGNHEYYYFHKNEFSYVIEEAGGRILREEAVALNLPQGTIVVAGLDDPFIDISLDRRIEADDDKAAYLERLQKTAVATQKVIEDCKAKGQTVLFCVLLAHRPEYINDYRKYDCFDLILSGHAHGGQWRIFNNGLYAPGQGWFPKYAGGRYNFKKSDGSEQTFIVSRGLSHQSPSFPRIGNPLELVVIDWKNND